MLFNSLHFALFFAIVLPTVAALCNRVRVRNIFLLLASWYFYGTWDPRFLILLIGSCVLDYFIGVGMNKLTSDQIGKRKLLLSVSCIANLGVLGFFKYFNFFQDSFVICAGKMGWTVQPYILQIVVPVGISFYVFQSLSYVIDVYRRVLKAETSFINFALFVAFFPQLEAGPIERATHLLPQIQKPTIVNWNGLCSGFWLIGLGLFKKVVMADNISKVADTIFNSGYTPTAWGTMIGVYAFAIQIYCDFSAYSDIARGAARTMGFDLMRNFNLPYFALNPSDFWKRWHISLSTWLRDYLYIPLGGNRAGIASMYRNLFLTMLLGGLWHGATWLYVLWGAYHGLLLILHRAIHPTLKRYINPQKPIFVQLWWLTRVVVFFQFTCFGWLLFRAGNSDNLMRMIRPFAYSDQSLFTPLLNPNLMLSFTVIALMLLVMQFSKKLRDEDHDLIFKIPTPLRAIIYALMILGLLIYGEFSGGNFIYFQF